MRIASRARRSGCLLARMTAVNVRRGAGLRLVLLSLFDSVFMVYLVFSACSYHLIAVVSSEIYLYLLSNL